MTLHHLSRRYAVALVVLIALGAIAWSVKGHGIRGKVADLVRMSPQPQRYIVQVMSCQPAEGAFEIPVSTLITAQLRLSRGGIDPASINDSTVMLIRTADQKPVAASVKLAGEQIIQLRPDQPLQRATNYTFCITGGVHHQSGAPVSPWASSFTTINQVDPSIEFEKVAQPNATGVAFTCLTIGPDGKLWAASDDGRFFIFPIESNGSLAKPRIIDSLQRANAGPRLVIGFCFDPASSPLHPIIWATNSAYTFNNAPDFSGKLTRLAGPDLEDVGDAIVNLPRSIRDHMTNQPSIGPDGAIYFPQGSNSSFGAPDEIWGMRAEHLLSATILRADRNRLTPGRPIDALTHDAGGHYDPFAPDAPLSIYATGIRNAYDLCWHSNGQLYVPTNGSSAGGHTPAGPDAPPIRDISTAEDDWLFKVTPGKYCGHPNPLHGHFVLNGGNPTADYDFAETVQYPLGVKPDPDFVPAIYSFGKHVSANGIIEYQSSAFAGRLKHQLLICRYNVGSDIIALALDKNGNVTSDRFGILGLSNLINPLDLTEDARTGNLYISEYGAMRITLCRPVSKPSLASPADPKD